MKNPIKAVIIAGVAAAVLVTATGAYRLLNHTATSRATAVAGAEQLLPVVLTTVREMVFEERISVSGNVAAKQTALVSARIPGVLEAIFVDQGDPVEPGQPLFQTDKVKLDRVTKVAEQQVAVAAATVNARTATTARIAADLAKVQMDFERYKRLYEHDRAVTQSAFEVQESHLKQVQASLAEAEAGLALARAQAQQAESNLSIARKDLADSLVAAPIGGKVSERMLEPGEMAGAGTAVLRIEDLSIVELRAYLPEIHYGRVVEGQTVVRARSGGIDIGEVIVTTKSPTIHANLRTFEIKALLRDPPYGVVPGARVDMTVVMQTRPGLGVPRASVLRRGSGQVVFTVREDSAHMLSVDTGLESDGWVAIEGAGLTPEMPIVQMGQERLNQGTTVAAVDQEAVE